MINNTKAHTSLSVPLQNRKIGFAQRIEARAAYFRTDTATPTGKPLGMAPINKGGMKGRPRVGVEGSNPFSSAISENAAVAARAPSSAGRRGPLC
ncbi:hypothetical protein LJR009_004653 [Bosea sp. LjRoot9]|uniref:hypothetical protein n=1 Tax=Bosea sp. LjRoot9 TaxID=3342341 RepID=UPI003ECD655B